jgi:hypothetical protein
MRQLISPIALVAGVLAFGIATPARADLEIWASTTHNPPTSGDKVTSSTLTVGSFSISGLEASTNSSGTVTIGQENGSTTVITNTGGSTATLYITVGSTGFIQPVGGVSVLSSIGGSITIGSQQNALTYQSYVDSANGQNTLTGYTPGSQTTPITTAGSYNTSASTGISNLSATYSLTEYLAITLGAGAEINFSSSTSVQPQAVPEPSTMAIAGLGALGLIGYGLRRRNAKGA